MALTVEKLNADSTFLLAFTPAFAPATTSSTLKPRKLPGAFTILIDPWLDGHSSILHPSFQIAYHTTSCAVKSLADLPTPPDLLVISQDKPDHCHRDTLLSLPPHWPTTILAVPSAAKKIKSWNHFDPAAIRLLPTYNPDKPASLVRIPLEPYTSTSSPGEITISHVPTKRDLTGVHNAVGITYRPPGSLFTAIEGSVAHMNDIIYPNKSPSPRSKRLRPTKSAFRLVDAFRGIPSHDDPFNARPHTADPESKYSLRSRSRSLSSQYSQVPPIPTEPVPPLPSLMRVDSKTASSTKSSLKPGTPPSNYSTSPSSPGTPPVNSRTHLEPTLSIIYSPHGLSPSALEPYITHHLLPSLALPLTALFHSMTTEENPWFMGGTVANGAPGGVDLLASLGGPAVRCWVGAHDEEKRHLGLATKFMRTTRWEVDQVRNLLAERFEFVESMELNDITTSGLGEKRYTPCRTDVRVLEVGEVIRI